MQRTLAVPVLVLVLVLVGAAAGCPFYQDTIPESNYTSVTAALSAAAINGLPIRVCDGATTPATEVVPVLTNSVAFIGDERDVPNGGASFWVFENRAASPVITVAADAVSFTNLHLTFQETLVRVTGAGFVAFDTVSFFGGALAIDVAATDTNDASTGGTCTNCHFGVVGTGILYQSGDFVCEQCVFDQTRKGALVSRVPTGNPFARVELFFVNFVDVKNSLVRQTAPAGVEIPVTTSRDFNLANHMFFSRTFEDECPGFGAGAESPAPAPCNCPPVLSKLAEVSVVLMVLAIFIIALMSCLFSTQRRKMTLLQFQGGAAAKTPA